MLKKIKEWLFGPSEKEDDMLKGLEQTEEFDIRKELKQVVELEGIPPRRAAKPKKSKPKRKPAKKKAKPKKKSKAKKKAKPKKKASKKSGKKTKREQVVSFLKSRKSPASIGDVAKKVGITQSTARRYLYYLKKEGKADKKGKGWVKK
jgi:DNA-binding transcriptional ArsR family regulator